MKENFKSLVFIKVLVFILLYFTSHYKNNVRYNRILEKESVNVNYFDGASYNRGDTKLLDEKEDVSNNDHATFSDIEKLKESSLIVKKQNKIHKKKKSFLT
ncbi:hypothetical protein MKS88_005237 [Plasmodium brasilianum]|uniref:Uncharacterized protein n=1 Tax=Plasmodium brasilianum TaxID=5824 RepID=A0ACB9Y0D3_PLABR|nr:hypothetical protein MKS88_005237 [Plasmodium brasilianum]